MTYRTSPPRRGTATDCCRGVSWLCVRSVLIYESWNAREGASLGRICSEREPRRLLGPGLCRLFFDCREERGPVRGEGACSLALQMLSDSRPVSSAREASPALQTRVQITVCHFPPGTSKWNKVEHRLFSRITMNWRGRPLTSHEVLVQTIAATTTRLWLRLGSTTRAPSQAC